MVLLGCDVAAKCSYWNKKKSKIRNDTYSVMVYCPRLVIIFRPCYVEMIEMLLAEQQAICIFSHNLSIWNILTYQKNIYNTDSEEVGNLFSKEPIGTIVNLTWHWCSPQGASYKVFWATFQAYRWQ